MSPKLEDSVFLSACRRQPVPYTPVWFMRQAGRSLPEYRAARRRTSMVEACTKPDLVTELTLQPLRRYPVDAAILFSDIVVPLRAAGVGIDIRAGVGPVVEQPIREERDLQRLRPLPPGEIHYVAKAVEAVVAELDTIVGVRELGAVGSLPDERLGTVAEQLEEFERRVSQRRRALVARRRMPGIAW